MLMPAPVLEGSADEKRLIVSPSGDLYVHQYLPPLFGLVKDGRVFSAKESSTTTCATAVPTTTAGFTLQNPAGSGKIYVVLGAGFELDVNAASLEATGIVGMVNKNVVANFTRDVTGIQSYLGGGGGVGSQAILDAGATVVDDGWRVLTGQVSNVKNSAAWGQSVTDLAIPIVLLEGGAMSLEGISSSATTEVALLFIWAELDKADF